MKKFLIFLGCTIGVAAIIAAVLTLSGISIFGFNFGNSSDNTPHEHSFGEWAVVEEATCTENGTRERACACGEKETEAIEAAGHNYTSVVTIPTCTADGFTTYTCSSCNDTYVDNTVTATGHSYTSVVTDPTCTADGYTTYTCSGCNDIYTDNIVTSTGHSYSSVVTDPTCTADGYTTYTCGTCGDSYTNNVTEANGHSNGTAGEKVKYTCTEYGYTNYTCGVCGDIYADDYTAPAHSYGEWVLKLADETTDTYVRTCSCGATQTATTAKASTKLAMEYSEELGGYVVTGRGACTDEHIVIPTHYQGPDDEEPIPVVAIASADTDGDGSANLDGSFYGDSTIKSLTIIGGVKTIGSSAFENQSNLKKIVILGGVDTIEYQAFAYCSYVETVVISDSVTNIKYGALAFLSSWYLQPLPTLYYMGTEDQWQNIILEDCNLEFDGSPLIGSIIYNYVYEG